MSGFDPTWLLATGFQEGGWVGLILLALWILNQLSGIFGKGEEKKDEGGTVEERAEREARRAEVRRQREEASRAEVEKLRARRERQREGELASSRPDGLPPPPKFGPPPVPTARPAAPEARSQRRPYEPVPAGRVQTPPAGRTQRPPKKKQRPPAGGSAPAAPGLATAANRRLQAVPAPVVSSPGLLQFDGKPRDARLARLQRMLSHRGQLQTALVLSELLAPPVALRE